MNTPESIHHITLIPEDHKRLPLLLGQLNENLRLLEYHLGVEINNHGHDFELIGPPKVIHNAAEILRQLYETTMHDHYLCSDDVLRKIRELAKDIAIDPYKKKSPPLTLQTQHVTLRPRTANQQHYLESMQQYDINFSIGPSGTGKTFMAVACAVDALEKATVKRIILTRPAVEAGEKLGYLPGSLSEKIDPYLRPLYDALQTILKTHKIHHLIETGIIEILPLAYMRGRTLNDSFIILDEAQNATREQMKMFLTRIGFGSKVVITGDITQTDLPKHIESGLRHAVTLLKDIQGIHFTFLTSKDIVRHPIVQDIIEAYEREVR